MVGNTKKAFLIRGHGCTLLVLRSKSFFDVYIKGCIKAIKRGFWRKDESEKLSQRGYENVILINGKEEFKCPSCDKIFKHRSVLCTHIDLVHEKKKPYLCNKCGYM